MHSGYSSDGTFSVSFRPQKEEDTNPYASAYQTYEVSATVTDSKGETQEANYTFSVGESSIVLFTNLPPQIEKDSVKAVVEARTINGEMVSTSGTFKIVELIANRSDKNSGESYKEGKQVASGSFTSSKEISPAIFNPLPSGRYRILVEAKDSQGRPSKNQSDFILYGKERQASSRIYPYLAAEREDNLFTRGGSGDRIRHLRQGRLRTL